MNGSEEKAGKKTAASGPATVIQDASDSGQDRPMHFMTVGHLARVMALAMGCLAVFESEGLLNWTMRLPTGRVGDAVVMAAGEWHDLMTSIGATKVHIILRAGFLWFKSLTF